jgi:cysteinyl-tRNA synthetase
MRLYNTLGGKKEEFVPLKKGSVLMYTCGPTVHDYAHIGNFRTFVFQDLLKRWLLYKGFKVKHVMNITDVDEKTIERAKRKKVGLKDVTKKYKEAFFEDIDTLNIEGADVYPEASRHIDEMVDISKRLLEAGFAFRGKDGSIYFDVLKSPGYGTLSKKKVKANLKRKTKREDYDEPAHFALWKPRDEMDADVYWKTPLGEGRPGWHCECASMAYRYLGGSMDIHSGGVDLVFPHHENGRAMSEALTGKQFSKYYLHAAHLIINGEKMSKTLRNCYTLRDILKMGCSPASVRLVLLGTHYRKKLNFTFKNLEAAEKKILLLESFVQRLKDGGTGSSPKTLEKDMIKMKRDFEKALDDDMDSASALRVFFGFIDKYKSKEISRKDAKRVLNALDETNEVLGLLRNKK